MPVNTGVRQYVALPIKLNHRIIRGIHTVRCHFGWLRYFVPSIMLDLETNDSLFERD